MAELVWLKKRIENRIRFGPIAQRHILDRGHQVVLFEAGSIFAFVRCASNKFGTIFSQIDILRAVTEGERCSTVPGVRPGGEILLRHAGWRKVERCCRRLISSTRLGSIRRTLHRSIGASSTTVCSSMKGLVRTRKRDTRR